MRSKRWAPENGERAGLSDGSTLVHAGALGLPGDLTIPQGARGLVVFAHGSGSSRASPRNRAVAQVIRQDGFGTLLFDLLTEPEALDRNATFDIPLLADRLEAVCRWVADQPDVRGLPIGLFGASTGAAAALVVAARDLVPVRAVVSRGGRPDLAESWLRGVEVPVLFIVGGADQLVLELNRRAMEQMPGLTRLEVIPGAGHLFEEPGALDAVTALAADWFRRFLSPPGATSP